MDARQERRARNESLFRDVNERIAGVRQTLAVASDEGQFVCECHELGCAARFTCGLSEYEQLRADPTTFAVVPGHEDPSVENVLEERGEYTIVRKHPGEPAQRAAEDSPR